MEIVKANVRSNNTGEIVCPHCQRLTKISIEDIQKYRSRISCSCQNDFIAEVDVRDKYRKPVDLPGRYCLESREECASEDPAGRPHNCQVIDISRNGIGILVTDGSRITEGDILELDFKLDDTSATEIRQRCEVRHVKNTYAGCKILNDIQALGMYLLQHGKP